MNKCLKMDSMEKNIKYSITLPFQEYNKNDHSMRKMQEVNGIEFVTHATERKCQQTVLIIENDSTQAEVLASMLYQQYDIKIVYSAHEAMFMIDQQPEIAVVIMNEGLPEINGLELTKQIRQKVSMLALPIMMTMSCDSLSDLEELFAAGINDYIIKPVSKSVLLTRLSVIERSKWAMTKAIENEMSFFQSRIKPHFLYNAISNIISFCYTDGEKAAHLLSLLSFYIRNIFESRKDGYYSTLQNELDLIHAYVEVERARFSGKLEFSCVIDKSIDPNVIEIPSLLIQPLIENAIRHGLFEKEGKGHVQLMIAESEYSLIIHVIDDGVGMTEEKCKELIEDNKNNHGLGLINVLRRIREIPQGNIMIQSNIGKGTTITLTIPNKENENVEGNGC